MTKYEPCPQPWFLIRAWDDTNWLVDVTINDKPYTYHLTIHPSLARGHLSRRSRNLGHQLSWIKRNATLCSPRSAPSQRNHHPTATPN